MVSLGSRTHFYVSNTNSVTDIETTMSAPRSACRELVLSIVQCLPVSLIDETTLPKVYSTFMYKFHLLNSVVDVPSG